MADEQASFEDRVVFIPGATGGIGQGVSRALAGRGGKVIALSRNADALQKLQEELGDSVATFEGDATREEDVQAAVKGGRERFGPVDGVVHAVGSIYLKPLQGTSLEDFLGVLHQNLVSAFLAIQACMTDMLKKKNGSVVCISSIAGGTGLVNHEAIGAAKAGLEGLVKSAAMTYARRGVRFNAVALGLVDTPLASFLFQNDSALKASREMHPMGRTGAPEEVVPAILYLLSDASAWTTGAVLPIDGGMAGGRGR